MNTSKLAHVASVLITFLGVHFLEYAHRIHMFDNACGNVDYDPKLKQWKYWRYYLYPYFTIYIYIYIYIYSNLHILSYIMLNIAKQDRK